jgi:hypothetical protein
VQSFSCSCYGLGHILASSTALRVLQDSACYSVVFNKCMCPINIPVLNIMVGHWLKSEQNGSMAAKATPGPTG